MWDRGSEPRLLPPLRRLPRLPRRVPKTQILLLYASLQSSRGPRTLSCDAQAAELVRVPALSCTREHRKINFHQKNTYDLEDLFSCFCHGSREQPAGSGSRQRQQGAASRQQYGSSRQLRQAAVGRLRADTSSQAGSIRQQQAVAATGSSR